MTKSDFCKRSVQACNGYRVHAVSDQVLTITNNPMIAAIQTAVAPMIAAKIVIFILFFLVHFLLLVEFREYAACLWCYSKGAL